MTSRHWFLGVFCLGLAGLPLACGVTELLPESFMLQISSEEPLGSASLDRVRVLFAQETEAGVVRFPELAEDGDLQVGADFDPVQRAEVIAIRHDGATFDLEDKVLLVVSGLGASGDVLTRFVGEVDLDRNVVMPVRLVALVAGCDLDDDGFPDCSLEGCCEVGTDGAPPLGDCDPSRSDVTPWVEEDPCTQCGDGIDQDCDGVDTPCEDDDADGYPLCVDCDDSDPEAYPDRPELCDGVDNNCNGKTDEAYLGLGESCGLGACAGGTMVCHADGLTSICSTADQASPVEDCDTDLDDNCNGVINEGCDNDLDGDGATVDGDGILEEGEDCNDKDAGFFPSVDGAPGADEPCCLNPQDLPINHSALISQCDRNCDGEIQLCAEDDKDGDGFGSTGGIDCDDTDPSVNPEAAEKCGDGIDQDCFGGDQPCAGLTDLDGDGWPAEYDCDDGDPDVHPWAPESCNGKDDDCDGYVDDGNPDTNGGIECGTNLGACQVGQKVCVGQYGEGYAPGEVICYGEIAPIAELCDLVDNDCDGSMDEDFSWEGLGITEHCDGTGLCGDGRVECLDEGQAICSSMLLAGTPAGPNDELCDNLDNDCDGAFDEGITDYEQSNCKKHGVCLESSSLVEVSCKANEEQPLEDKWNCGYDSVPLYEDGNELTCDGSDNDCDGLVDEDFEIGGACDGDDADECLNGFWECAPALPSQRLCNEQNAEDQTDTCDGADNDCDGLTDEDFKDPLWGQLPNQDGPALGESCGVGQCAGGVGECKPAPDGSAEPEGGQCSTMPGGTVAADSAEVCDGMDNDCDGEIDEGLDSVIEAQCKLVGVCNDVGVTTADCVGPPQLWQCYYDGDLVTVEADHELGFCDNLDNDCDNKVDEDFSPSGTIFYTEPNGEVRSLGEPCGLGACYADSPQNLVQCDPNDPSGLFCPAYQPTTEVCDNKDNDCDGVKDEDFTESWGAYKLLGALFALDELKQKGDSCGTGACAGGQVTCDPNDSMALVCSTDTLASVELCNGVDDDCDGQIDETFLEGGDTTYNGGPYSPDAGATKGDPCGTGACDGGTVVCNALSPAQLTCSSLTSGSPDVCNGLDDDCDGQTDEDFKSGGLYALEGSVNINDAGKVLGMSCGFGECNGGTVQCDPSDPTLLTCSTYANVADDICDGDDNDCDGGVDEAFKEGGIYALSSEPYAADAGKVLDDPCGTGACKNGQVECSNDGLSLECSKWHKADPEVCDNKDNDCDGVTDENYKVGGDQPYIETFAPFLDRFLGQSCGTGVCSGGVVACEDDDIICTTGELASAADASCNGKDDDCNGITDDMFLPGADVSLDDPYTVQVEELGLGDTCGVGACSGLVVCKGKSSLECDGEGNESPDLTCNGQDEDCDDVIDESVPTLGDACDGNDDDLCATGSLVCPADLSSETPICEELGAPITDICNDLDDDCDGAFDETFPLKGQACDGADQDQCLNGTWSCQAGGLACLDDAPNISEACGGGDEDCDGEVDEGFDLLTDPEHCGSCNTPCVHPTVSSWLCVVGACEVDTCDDPTDHDLDGVPTNGCECSETLGGVESCNGQDEDCDGSLDEDFDLATDPEHCGACQAPCEHPSVSSWLCVAGACEVQTCDQANTYDVDQLPENGCECTAVPGGLEICNGQDEDCDGEIDENLAGSPCDQNGDGCAEGTQTCSGGVGECMGDSCPVGQVCDGESCVDEP